MTGGDRTEKSYAHRLLSQHSVDCSVDVGRVTSSDAALRTDCNVARCNRQRRDRQDGGNAEISPGGVDRFSSLSEQPPSSTSLRCAKQRGVVCMTGMVGNKWSFDAFSPMDAIPTAVPLTTYSGGAEDFKSTPLDLLAQQIANGQCLSASARPFTWTRSSRPTAAWRKTRPGERS